MTRREKNMLAMGPALALALILATGVAGAAETAAPAKTKSAASPAKSAASSSKSAAPAKPRATAAPRALDDIHIEGEIPVPQVLFITARDQRRFMDFHHRRYLKSSRELGEATRLPTRIAFTRGEAVRITKEPAK